MSTDLSIPREADAVCQEHDDSRSQTHYISLPTFLEASAVCNTCSARAVPFAHMDTSLVVTVFEAEAFVLLALLYTSRLGRGGK
jgi:hypothetical protein